MDSSKIKITTRTLDILGPDLITPISTVKVDIIQNEEVGGAIITIEGNTFDANDIISLANLAHHIITE